MPDWSELLSDYGPLLWWLAAGSVVMFLGTLAAMPLVIARIPEDYFTHAHRHALADQQGSPWLRLAVRVGKNLLGAVLVLGGIAMLVLPGQGLLTIVVGLLLMNFPGKYRLERWLVTRRRILRAINRLRQRMGREPLRVDGEGADDVGRRGACSDEPRR